MSSRPSRARGLKLLSAARRPRWRFASITGAWIETLGANVRKHHAKFASITGAWIETPSALQSAQCPIFASITGAWIETYGRY